MLPETIEKIVQTLLNVPLLTYTTHARCHMFRRLHHVGSITIMDAEAFKHNRSHKKHMVSHGDKIFLELNHHINSQSYTLVYDGRWPDDAESLLENHLKYLCDGN